MSHADNLFEASIPDWRVYERVAPAIISENLDAGIDCSATMNARLVGAISGVERQIDLMVEARWDNDRTRRIIVDAKHYGRSLNVKDIESFEGMMRDCRAEHGILVCTNGWSPGAERRAKEVITLKILTLQDALEGTDWAVFEECYGRCQEEPDPRRRGVVLWNGQLPLVLDDMYAIVWTGKCDVCRCFQVWCWDCGAKFSLAPGDSLSCDCDRRWSAPTLEEAPESTGGTSLAVHLLLTIEGGVVTIDRRSLN